MMLINSLAKRLNQLTLYGLSTMNKTSFQYYPAHINSNKPLGFITFEQFVTAQSRPKQKFIDVFNRIAEAELRCNNKLKSELKQNNLYYFTPCVHVNEWRRYVNVTKFTGLMVVDFDHIDNAKEFKKYLFETYPFFIYCYLSPSKKGVKGIVKIPVSNNIDEFKSYYFGLQDEMQQYEGYDSSPQNAVLPLFQSIDTEVLFRSDAKTWAIKGRNPKGIKDDPAKQYSRPITDDIKKERVIKAIETSINKIVDNGHPQLRSACIAVGGYVSAGRIGYYEAENIVFDLIESNTYLQKGVPGYKKTARWAINEGTKHPIYE